MDEYQIRAESLLREYRNLSTRGEIEEFLCMAVEEDLAVFEEIIKKAAIKQEQEDSDG